MSATSAIATIKRKMTDFKNALAEALGDQSSGASHAEVADKLDGKTPAEVIALLRDEVGVHTRKLHQGVHKVDFEAMDTYSAEEYDDKISQFLENGSGLPLSFYGDREYLPPPISGSFESGSNLTPWNAVAMMMEDNGTMMVLRTGTDGVDNGVFYSYLRKAANPATPLTDFRHTNTRYRPAYFPSDQYASQILYGGQDIVIGILSYNSSGARSGYFVSLTNNTLDMSKHTGMVIPASNNASINPQIVNNTVVVGGLMGYIKGETCYLLQNLNGDGRLGFRVWSIPKANLISGAYQALTRVTGWRVDRGSAGVYSSSDMLLFTDIEDALRLTGKSQETYYPANGTPGGIIMVNQAGRVTVMISHYMGVRPLDGLVSADELQQFYCFEIADSKTINVAKYHDQITTCNYGTAGKLVISPSPAYQYQRGSWQDFPGSQEYTSWYMNKYNQMFGWTSWTLSSNRRIFRALYPEQLDPFMVFNLNLAKPANSVITDMVGNFASPVTNNFRMHGNVGENTVVVYNEYPEGPVMTLGGVRVTVSGSMNYRYGTINNYGYLGFPPNLERYTLKELSRIERVTQASLNEASSNGFRVSGAIFPYLSSVYASPRAAQIGTTLLTSGTVTLGNSVLGSLNTQIRTMLSSKGVSLKTAVSGSSNMRFELVVPQLYTSLPAFVFGHCLSSTGAIYDFVCSVAIAGTRQAVTGASLQTSTYVSRVLDSSLGSPGLGLLLNNEMGQSCIRQTSSGYVLGMIPSAMYWLSGDQQGGASLLTYSTAGRWAFNGSTLWNYTKSATAGFMNFPSLGLYFTLCSESLRGAIDGGTKLLATLITDTGGISDNNLGEYYLPRVRQNTSSRVILSQKTPSAWSIYFTDDAPVMLDGDLQTLPKGRIDLDEATAAGKRFYIWAVKTTTGVEYRVVDTTATPTGVVASLYLGYLVTTVEGIQTIVTEKRIAIGGVELARVSQGAGIPLTSGTPNTAGKLNWS